jgi:hypothetical protein
MQEGLRVQAYQSETKPASPGCESRGIIIEITLFVLQEDDSRARRSSLPDQLSELSRKFTELWEFGILCWREGGGELSLWLPARRSIEFVAGFDERDVVGSRASSEIVSN